MYFMSKHRKTSMGNSIKERLEDIKDWVFDHLKIVMPVVLLICVGITVIIAINANKKAAAEAEAQIADNANIAEASVIQEEMEEIPEAILEEDAYPKVNELISKYYEARTNGDVETIAVLNPFIKETEKIRIQETSKYIETYQDLKVYTKAGIVEDTFLAYVYSKIKFDEYEQAIPGMEAYYVCPDENGNYYINEGEDNKVITDYIKELSLQDDVIELNNKIAVEFNELLEIDDEVNAFLVDVKTRIDESVGEVLAKAEAAETEEQTEEPPEEDIVSEGLEDTEVADAETTNVVKTVRAIDVVNIRSSDSETADKLGKAQIGDEFKLLEEKGNGWSKITYEGKDGYIKSQYLEVESEEEITSEQTAETTNTESTNTPAGDGKTVTVIDNVNVRKSASETGEKLGLVYIGEKLELIMKQADGWTKVKYKNQTAYVKSEYVE